MSLPLGWLGGLGQPKATSPKRRLAPSTNHSLSSTAQQLTLLWLGLEKPTKELSCAVGVVESGGESEVDLLVG